MPEQAAEQARVQEKLDFWLTVRHAILGLREPPSDSSIREIANKLDEWKPDSDKLDSLLLLSHRSLAEVIRLTEYEDGKANRILMSMAFLSALAGVLFSKFADKYHQLLSEIWTLPWFLVALVYLLFFVYVIVLILGVISVLYAVMPRFNIPRDWKHKLGNPASLLFFEKIIEVTPATWAEAFSKRSPDELKRDYINNSVLESYLVAEKIRSKLRKLQPGLRLLWRSTQLFCLWITLYGAAIISLPKLDTSQDLSSRLLAAESQVKNMSGEFQSIEEQLKAHKGNNEELARRISTIGIESTERLNQLTHTVERLNNQLKLFLGSQKGQQTVPKGTAKQTDPRSEVKK